MALISYAQLALQWRPDHRRDRVFMLIAFFTVSVLLLAAFVISSIPVPKDKRDKIIVVPERVAKFITERPKPKPQEQPKPLPVPKPRPEPKFQRQKPEEQKPLTKVEERARKKAEDSGLLALTKELSGLMDTSNINSMVGNTINKSDNRTTVASVSTDVLTNESKRGSGGISERTHVAVTGKTTLDDNQRELAKQLLASKGEITTASKSKDTGSGGNKARGDNVRSEEDVAYVMDKHKSMLHSIYKRARRANPSLKGKIVLEITILPSGKVSNVRIKSSELNDAALESSLVSRIKQLDFGARSVETLTVTVPVEFLPS